MKKSYRKTYCMGKPVTAKICKISVVARGLRKRAMGNYWSVSMKFQLNKMSKTK
jgi:hypothetical protein